MTIKIPDGRTLGIDVSFAQRDYLPWKALREAGVRFSLARTGQGIRIIDQTFVPNCEGASSNDILPLSYHFLECDVDPAAQARQYARLAKDHAIAGPWMDFEQLRGVEPKKAVQVAEAFVLESEQLWGKVCAVYLFPSFWSESLGNPESEILGSRPLHIAHYGVKNPIIPRPWEHVGWTLHQWDGDKGERMPDGRDCDFNWYAGDYPHLLQFLQGAPFAQTQQDPGPTSSFDKWAASLNLTDATRQTSDDDIAARERSVSEAEDEDLYTRPTR